jgi:hypothetical protein
MTFDLVDDAGTYALHTVTKDGTLTALPSGCTASVTSGAWHIFDMIVDLDLGSFSINVDDAATACADEAFTTPTAGEIEGLSFAVNSSYASQYYVDNLYIGQCI